MLKSKLYVLHSELTKGEFYGFTLQRGFIYGYNVAGMPFATSGFTCNGHIHVYTRKFGKWAPRWLDLGVFCRIYGNCTQEITNNIISHINNGYGFQEAVLAVS